MKNILMKIILSFLYRGIKVLNKKDSQMASEIKNLPPNYKVKIETDLSNSLFWGVEFNNGQVIKLKPKQNARYDLIIKFKHKNLAFKVLMGQKSISQAYCEHYFQLFGNIYDAMAFTRVLERVEGYLFPKFINKKILKEPIEREISMFKTYMLCLFII